MRKPFYIWLVVVCLAYLALAGLSGGYLLLKDPSGQQLGMPPEFLEKLPVSNYWMAGLFLLVVFGIAPVADIYGVLTHRRWALQLTAGIGAVLVVWMMLQFWLIGYQIPFQAWMLIIGLVIFSVVWFPKVREYFEEE
ncbi:MAG: hypothetical protein EPGJADBJ_02591 [Saprospiraceae bacterium]|nr:hypothetical protein [Saprospiraceae bacterium]